MIPKNQLLIDNTLNLFGLIYSVNYEDNYKKIAFYKIKGFNFKENSAYFGYYYDYEIAIEEGRFDFYINKKLISKDFCKTKNFNSKFDIFGPILNLNVYSLTKFGKNTCPLVFKNSKLRRLSLNQISNSLILKNQLEFTDINKTDLFSLNNHDFKYLNLGMAYESLNSRLLNKHVFKFINTFVIWGVVDGIESDLFKNFKNLKLLCLNVQNFKTLLEINNKWLGYLNNHVNLNLEKEYILDFVVSIC
jgi:hypothetical protein